MIFSLKWQWGCNARERAMELIRQAVLQIDLTRSSQCVKTSNLSYSRSGLNVLKILAQTFAANRPERVDFADENLLLYPQVAFPLPHNGQLHTE